MAKLVQHILVKDGREQTVNLYPHDDPNNTVWVKENGWRVKTPQSEEAKEIIQENENIMNSVDDNSTEEVVDEPMNDIGDPTDAEAISESSVIDEKTLKTMKVSELKEYMKAHNVDYNPKDNKARLLKKAIESLSDG